MKKKKFLVKVKAETIMIKFTDIEVDSTSATKARGAAEYQAEVAESDLEWSKPIEQTAILSSEIIE